jgi:hypothetical protein
MVVVCLIAVAGVSSRSDCRDLYSLSTCYEERYMDYRYVTCERGHMQPSRLMNYGCTIPVMIGQAINGLYDLAIKCHTAFAVSTEDQIWLITSSKLG